jgi:hypothetical protein
VRTINAAGLALLERAKAGEQMPVTQLVRIAFTGGTVFLTTAGHAIPWDGETWEPAGLGAIEAVADSSSEMPPLRFTMPAISAAQLAVALEPGTEGAAVLVYDALIDPDTGACEDAVLAWSGALNVPTLVDGPQADMTVTAEHRGMLAIRPKPSRYTDDEQRRLYPADTSLNFDPATDAKPLTWPAASFFKQ